MLKYLVSVKEWQLLKLVYWYERSESFEGFYWKNERNWMWLYLWFRNCMEKGLKNDYNINKS